MFPYASGLNIFPDIKIIDFCYVMTVILQSDEKNKILLPSGCSSIMKKRLSEMSLEELWQLFPIFLTRHQSHWDTWYREEAEMLQETIGSKHILRISHIGSTAITDIWAKPIIDILVEISLDSNLYEVKESILNNGYICMSESSTRISFNKGYTENGFKERVFHLHARYAGDNDELYFRDYLNENLPLAKQYESLKLSLWKKYRHNRDAYTDNKTEFISHCTQKAKKAYGSRYQCFQGKRKEYQVPFPLMQDLS